MDSCREHGPWVDCFHYSPRGREMACKLDYSGKYKTRHLLSFTSLPDKSSISRDLLFLYPVSLGICGSVIFPRVRHTASDVLRCAVCRSLCMTPHRRAPHFPCQNVVELHSSSNISIYSLSLKSHIRCPLERQQFVMAVNLFPHDLVTSKDPHHPANLICELCRKFYALGWVSLFLLEGK